MPSSNNKFMIGITIFIVIILILSGIYFVYAPHEEIKKETPAPTTGIIDDHISPGVDQGLIVEIDRIRHRGLIDKIFKIGSSWKDKPLFYYSLKIDDMEYISKDVSAAGGAESEILFNCWDSIGQENRVMKDVPEEQETSDVTITIIERIPKGLFGLKTQDVEREKIHVTYDYRTGRWTGDDYFEDSDGVGHYVGDTFEVWFNIYQTDFDHDGIPYWTEVNVLHTDPMIDDSKLDPDGDGIPTSWEWRWGYDPFKWDDHEHLDPDVDGIENIEEYKMSKWFADPYQPDIYIESDGMERRNILDWNHVFYEESQQLLIERFCEHGINLYIDNGWPGSSNIGGGELLPFIETISQDSGIMLQFYKHHFCDERKGIFRYLIIANNAGFCIPSTFNKYDTLVVDSSKYKVFIKRQAFTPRVQRIVLAAAVMHELGHSLGISPWTIEGCDNITYAQGRAARLKYQETWANYESVMNYYHIWDRDLVDYSDGSNGPPYDQNDWEHLYLPTFEIDANVMEDILIKVPAKDRMINETVNPPDKNWVYDENLTDEYISEVSKFSFVKNAGCEFRIYVNRNISYNDSMYNIKIYAKPKVEPTYAIWSLIKEGYLDEENQIHFYDIKQIIEDLRSSS